MSLTRIPLAFLAFFLLAWTAQADSGPAVADASEAVSAPAPAPWLQALDRYFVNNQQQQARTRGTSAEVEIDARLPRMKREGSLRAVRQISSEGLITYEASQSSGDKMVVKDVIARFLSAETEASKGIRDSRGTPQSLSIGPENYRFRQKAMLTSDGQQVHIIQLTPKKNRLGLFRGEIWLDAVTGLPLRESGRLVKNPSVFLKKVDFVREYRIVDGLAVPVRVLSRVETRLVGLAELDIRYTNHSAVLTARSEFCPLGW
ncbi:MAG: hypothetical protein ACE141_17160 [Bryobacteraceae bacterium]